MIIWGGFKEYRKLDFSTNQYMVGSFNPFIDENHKNNYQEFMKLDDSLVDEFINKAYKYGLFDLKEKYKNENVDDGGGWSLKIIFEDGTVKESWGSNAAPRKIFENIDYVFFDLFGEEFFGYVPRSYSTPPTLNIVLFDGTSMVKGISPTNYKWHNKVVDNIDNFEYALSEESHRFDNAEGYTLSIYDDYMTSEIKKIVVTSYNLNGENPKQVEFIDNKLILSLNLIYIFEVDYEYGTCEYVLATVVK